MTPEEWRASLDKSLEARREQVDLFEAYYDGEHPMVFSTSKWREAFGNMLRTYRDNWCDLVVDASVERLSVVGFRFGEPGGDDDAWRIWQANNLDEGSGLVHTDAVTCGESYVLVSPAPRGSDIPQLTPEHPSQVYVRTDPANSRRRLAAIKKWRDDEEFIRCNVYLPDGVVKFRSVKPVQGSGIVGGQMVSGSTQYERFGPDNGVEANPFGVVPIIPFVNRRRTLRGGRSDIDTVIPRQDFINKLGADLLVGSEFSAFRQRWATGLEVPTDEAGNPIEEYRSAVSRLWATADPDVRFGEFQASDLGNYVQAIEMMIQHVAATTRTPPHYLLGQSGAFPSGESLKATETGLVAKVKSKQTSFGESWEEVLRLAFLARDDQQRGSLIDAETLWRDPESRSEAEHVDATLKLKDILPWEFLMERLGYSPQEIARARSTRTSDALEAMFRQPAAPAPPDPTTVI